MGFLMKETSISKNKGCIFVKPSTYVYEIEDVFSKKKSHAQRISLVLITDNGKFSGKLLGIITETDLLKVNY